MFVEAEISDAREARQYAWDALMAHDEQTLDDQEEVEELVFELPYAIHMLEVHHLSASTVEVAEEYARARFAYEELYSVLTADERSD